MRTPRHLAAIILFCIAPLTQASDEPRFELELELGATWQEKNDVQIPNDRDGDRFSLKDVAGSGPWTSARVNFNWNITGPHGLRVVLAPFRYSERGLSEASVYWDKSLTKERA